MKSTHFVSSFIGLVLLSILWVGNTHAASLPDFTELVEDHSESVVNISTVVNHGGQSSQFQFQGDMDQIPELFRHFFGAPPKAPKNRGEGQNNGRKQLQSMGSGFIVSEDGLILTNNHVVEGADEIYVRFNDRKELKATLIGADKKSDLAVLKVEADDLPAVKFGKSKHLKVGEWVFAIGSPFGFDYTVTAGIVSAKGRSLPNENYVPFIQTDVAINPGNSGGALVNLEGKLIGINSAIATPTGTFAGYSFAIPSTLVEKVYRDLVEFGVVQRALLGITIQDVTAEIAKENDIPVLFGVLISGVNNGSAAFEAGLEKGDVITEINEVEIKNVSNLQEQIAINRPGDKVEVTYIRDRKTKNTIATLKNTLGTTEIVASNNNFSFDGAKFSDLSKELKEKLELEGGAQVISIEKGKWKNAGITKGFIVTSINKRAISDVEDLSTTLSQLPKDDGVLVEGMYPNGIKAYYGIGW